jgi:acyl-CoA thioesterase-1
MHYTAAVTQLCSFYRKPARTIASLLLLASLLAARPALAAPKKTLVCFGDSITAGYGLDADKSYPADLEEILDARGYRYRVVNQGVSGNTTKDAVERVHSVIALHPDVVVVEFGGNDGLRGLPMEITRKNLDTVLTALQAANVRVLLVGITLPPNYGADYIQQFNAVFHDAAEKHRVPLMPMLYDGIYKIPGTIQEDGIHPTAKGSELIAEHLMPFLKQLLTK